jgi:hypothetical protein
MKEINSHRREGAKRASIGWERLWRIYSYPDRATVEDLIWADGFVKANRDNMRDIAILTSDPEEKILFELVYLGLFHHGYELPLEFKYLRAALN